MDIIARTVNCHILTYECPDCWTSYKKNGEPTLRAKKMIHKHWSLGQINNRIENRISHCEGNHKNVDIHITDETRRI